MGVTSSVDVRHFVLFATYAGKLGHMASSELEGKDLRVFERKAVPLMSQLKIGSELWNKKICG